MNQRAMSLIEVVVSLVLLSIAALAISSSLNLFSKNTSGGTISGLENQAVNESKRVLEELKNSVSSTSTTAAALNDTSYTKPCSAIIDTVCGNGTTYSITIPTKSALSASGLNATHTYTVWDISDGNGKVAYKKVTSTVTWDDPV